MPICVVTTLKTTFRSNFRQSTVRGAVGLTRVRAPLSFARTKPGE
jgi:hypothetical protein